MRFDQSFGGLITGAKGAVLTVLLGTGTPLTGRQIHRLVADRVSRASVQTALVELGALGVIQTKKVGRANLHSINERHLFVAPLRQLFDPIAALRRVVAASVSDASAVILFGSVARGEARPDSDIDLAVIAPDGWDGGFALAEVVEEAFGNACDVLVFTPERFATSVEPVISDVRRDGITLMG